MVMIVFPVRIFIFELYVEKKCLLGNMNLAEALGAFLHLCFVFDLLYPKVNLNLILD